MAQWLSGLDGAWWCHGWHGCSRATSGMRPASVGFLGWSSEGDAESVGSVFWARGRAVSAGSLLAARLLCYQDYVWHQNQRSWLSPLFFLCFQDLNNRRLLWQFV